MDELSRKIFSLTNAGQDASTLISTLINSRYSDGGWGLKEGDSSNPLDTSLALQALKAANYSDLSVVNAGLAFLTSSQNADGGWGYRPTTTAEAGDPSNAYVTSIVLRTLSNFSSQFIVQGSIDTAKAYLLTKQNTDGGFGSSPSTIYETALSIISLIESGQGGALPLQNAIAYLAASQSSNGSWNDDPYSTALALQAMAKVKPNLTITSADISFSQTTPVPGEAVTISVMIHNTGLAAADSVVLQLFDGDPAAGGLQIGSLITLPSIAPGGTGTAQVVHTMTTDTDRHAVHAIIDPLNTIDELVETDNTAVNYYTIFSPSDLFIDNTETTYAPVTPTVDEPLNITINIRNLGEKEATNVPVRVYRGLPGSGGTVVNDFTITSLQGRASYPLTATITGGPAGTQAFYLVIDPEDSIPELDETNNQGMITITVEGSKPTDLAITASNIGFLFPSGAEPGKAFTITAVVTNSGSRHVDTSVSFYRGDPAAGGSLIGTTPITVPALTGQSAAFTWTIPTDNPLIYAVVDPGGLIVETDETNNKAYRGYDPVAMLPDLSITAADISSFPACVTPRSKLFITASVANYGGNAKNGYTDLPFELWNGAPESSGARVGTFYLFPDGSTTITAMGTRTGYASLGYLTVGEHMLHVIADPSNIVQEFNEANNRAVFPVTVRSSCPLDLSISDADITLSPALPLAGSSVNISATVHNSGSELLYADVSFYNGNPASGGALIRASGLYINQVSVGTVTVPFTMTLGVPEIYVVVDPGKKHQETDENNNSARKTIPTYKVDLSVGDGDLLLSPAAPSAGDSVSVNVTIYGTGAVTVSGTLSLYEGTPEQGRLIGQQALTFYAGGRTSAVFPGYVYPGDGVTLTAVIENVAPQDADPSNNRVSAVFGEHIAGGATHEGTDFWLAWPPTYYDTAKIVIQSDEAARVTVTTAVPLYQTSYHTWTVDVAPGAPAVIPLMASSEVNDTKNVVENKGIRIQSDRKVSVVFHAPDSVKDGDDSYRALPVHMLGTEYYVMTYYPGVSQFWFPGGAYTIVAAENNTEVNIGGSSIRLEQGQTYVYNTGNTGVDLTGTRITSNRPIGVFGSAYRAFVTSSRETSIQISYGDVLLEQMLPVSLLGTDYYSAPLYSPGSGDVFRIMAVRDNTQVVVKNQYHTARTFTLQAGQWTEFEQEEALRITGSQPISVAQYAKGIMSAKVGDPFQMTLIPTDKLRTAYRFYSFPGYGGYNSLFPEYSKQGNFVTIIAPEPETAVTLDGVTVTDGWLPLTDAASYALLSVNEGEHVIVADKPVGVYVHGYGMTTSYGYPAGLATPLNNLALSAPVLTPAAPTEGQLVELSATLTNESNKAIRDVLVRAYLGDPANNGTQIGQGVYHAVVAPKQTSTVAFAWDTLGHAGPNKLYLVADPLNTVEESNESDNTVMLTANITAPMKPDLAILASDITLTKETATEGETVVLTARIRNRGAAVGAVPVRLYRGDPQSNGALLGTRLISQMLELGGEAMLDFTIQTLGLPDTNDFHVVIDPANIIDELAETNNTAMKRLAVNRKKLSVGVMTDRGEYQAQSVVGINLAVKNEGGAAWSGSGNIFVETVNGRQIAHVAAFTVSDLEPWGMEGWGYRVPVTVTETRNVNDAVALVFADFDGLLASLGVAGRTIDTDSIRVLEYDGMGNAIGEKQAKAAFVQAMPSKVTWLMDGLTTADVPRHFYLFFDTTDYGAKQPSTNTKIPLSGRLIALSDDKGRIYVQEDLGSGTFSAPRFIDDVSPNNDITRGIVLDDFNSDGFADIVTGSGFAKELYYYQNRADGTNTFLPRKSIGQIGTITYLYDMASADFNGDGKKDFVVGGSKNTLYLYTGNGDGTFTQTTIPAPAAWPIDAVFIGKTAADVDHDGLPDLIVTGASGPVYVYRGNGNGTFLMPENLGIPGGGTTATDSVTAGDFDEDGKVDIIANKTHTGDAYFFKGKGDGTFGAPVLIPSLDIGNYSTTDTADVNGDGHLDVIAAVFSGYVEVYSGNGDGTFGTKSVIATGLYENGLGNLGISVSLASPEVHPVLGAPEALPRRMFNFTWNTGTTYAGGYKVHVQLSDGGTVAAESTASFDILPDTGTSAVPVTDKISYSPNEAVAITSTIASLSGNYIFENLSAKLTIGLNSSNGLNGPVFVDTKTVSTLMPGASFTFTTYWNTGTFAPGTYPVTLEVKDASGTILSTGSASIVISSDIKPSAALSGAISVQNQNVLSGDSVNATYSILNKGNTDLAEIGISVLIVDAAESAVYATIPGQASLPMGAGATAEALVDTTGYSAKDYLVVLQASLPGPNGPITETLAGTYFRVQGAPTAPSLSSPPMGSDVGTLTPVLVVNNASDPNQDTLTYEFEVYADTGLVNLIVGSGMRDEGGNGLTAWTVPVALIENQTYYWRSRAFDGWLYGEWMTPTASFRVNVENDPPTAPTLASPADRSDVDTLQPVLTVNNASDPDSTGLTYNFDIALDPEFTQIVDSITGVAEGPGTTSWQVSVQLLENTTYYWRVQADDWLVEGDWMTTASFFVNTTNDAPSAPAIIAPLNNEEIASQSADIIVTNSTDPDSTGLTYIFEVDRVRTFDSPDLRSSGPIAEGLGTTLWRVADLADNTVYYVRAKAYDGFAESDLSQDISFFVNTANDAPAAPILANPSPGSGVNVSTPTLSVHNSIDPDRDVLTYEFQVYADAGLENLIVGSGMRDEGGNGVTSWTVPVTLNENQTYYWQARAFDGEAQSGWMTPASFMVNAANDAPEAPRLNAPVEGGSVDTLRPALSIHNAEDPDSDQLTYDFEIYIESVLVQKITGVPESDSGITSLQVPEALLNKTKYRWRAQAHDGERYGEWMDMATFSVHLPVTSINATIDFDPNTLNQGSNGTWVVVYIELPAGYAVKDIDVSSVRLEGVIPAVQKPCSVGDYDKDGIPDLMVKFKRSDVIALLLQGEKVPVHVSGTVGTTTFDGVDIIRVIK
ncbi:MAG: hypothetical protein A2X56_13130 [Nitrospirae bacterium GWC2_57_13]|nr:MAG: hypothetical protein A2X56_13130 [Nitrospirae bacterium GWC2_57_13]